MPAQAPTTTFGQHLRHYRRMQRLTQTALARMANVHRVTIANLETDQRQPTLLTARQIARALHCTIDDLHAGPGLLAQNVLHLRLSKHWTVKDLSSQSGMRHSEIANIESGSKATAIRPLARVFGVSATDLRTKQLF